MCRLFLCPHCPLLWPIGGPGTEAYLWGVGGRLGSLEGDSFLFPKPHKSLDTDLRVMCIRVVYTLSSPAKPTTFPFFSPCCLVAIPSIPPSSSSSPRRPLVPPVQPRSLSSLSP